MKLYPHSTSTPILNSQDVPVACWPCHHLGSVAGPYLGAVLVKGHVPYPMHPVLDVPMLPENPQQPLCPSSSRSHTGHRITHRCLCPSFHRPLPLYPAYLSQVRPPFPHRPGAARVAVQFRIGQSPQFPPLPPAMALLRRLIHPHRQRGPSLPPFPCLPGRTGASTNCLAQGGLRSTPCCSPPKGQAKILPPAIAWLCTARHTSGGPPK